MTRSLYIKTYGCQMNAYDSQRMADVLAPLGFKTVEGPEDADMVILNTCHIREKASEKVYSELGRLRVLKDGKAQRGGRMMIAVAGCVAQAEGGEILSRAPVVDVVVGPQAYHRLGEMVMRAAREGGQVLDTEFPVEDKFDALPESKTQSGVSAFLTVQEGCDKFCTFCVVPYTRGAEYSRPVTAIESEARRLIENGAREITLLGQNVNAYHGAGLDGEAWGLGRLIRHLAGLSGLLRLRYTTSHPRDMDDDLIRAHAEIPALMPYLHLPVQSGSDRILDAMNRGHTADDYRRLIDKIRKARPDIAMSGDFIVGFPGESDADFQATMALVRDVTYAQAYSFMYSPRPGTPAAVLRRQVPQSLKTERLQELQSLLNAQQVAFNEACLGREMDVLLERPGRNPGQMGGRSPYLQAVHVSAPEELTGRLLRVAVTGIEPRSLTAQAVGHAGVFQEAL